MIGAILVGLVLGQSAVSSVGGPIYGSGGNAPAFEFAPLSGAGMGAACGHCANLFAYPQSLDIAPWTTLGSGVAAPTVTANAAIAPDGTLTADRFQFPATAAGQYSIVYQTKGTGVASSISVYVMGVSGSGTIDICSQAGPYTCTSCSYVSTAWTLCKRENVTIDVTSDNPIGNATQFNGGTTRVANDVYLWGTQLNTGATANTYVHAPAGANGAGLTFTRSSSATCLQGNNTTSIANGNMVTCAAGQARVMPGGDGTGARGLLVEGARTNDALRSQELDDPAWVDIIFGGPAAPVRTANAAVAPDGTLTAERLQFPAVAAGQYSMIGQNLAGANRLGSAFVKGNGQSGTLWVNVAGTGGTSCGPCSYNATTWTRCVTPGVITGTTAIYVGVDQFSCATSNQGTKDVFVWGAQAEVGTFASSYIATTAATVTRSAETATFPVSLTNATGSMAATMTTTASFTDINDHAWISASTAGPAYAQVLDFRASVPAFTVYGGAAGGVAIVGPLLIGDNRAFAFWTSAASVNIGFNGATASGSWTAPIPATTLVEIGTYSGVSTAFSVIKQVCVDPSPSRCR